MTNLAPPGYQTILSTDRQKSLSSPARMIVVVQHVKWEDPGADVIGPGDGANTRVRIDNNPMLLCSIDGFTGSKAVLFLVPLVWNLVVLAFGLSLIGLASLGIAGQGAFAGGR